VRIMNEQEDKYEVDPDWVMPQLTNLLRDGGRLDQEVRKLDNTYSTRQVLVCGCLESPCGVGSGAQRLAGS
jgi:hypothetical protein